MKKSTLLVFLSLSSNACGIDAYKDYLTSMTKHLKVSCQEAKSLKLLFLKDQEPKGILLKKMMNSPFKDKSLYTFSTRWREINE